MQLGPPGDVCEFLHKDKAWQRKGSGITPNLSRKGKSLAPIQKAPLPACLSQEFSELGQRSLLRGRQLLLFLWGVGGQSTFLSCFCVSSLIPSAQRPRFLIPHLSCKRDPEAGQAGPWTHQPGSSRSWLGQALAFKPRVPPPEGLGDHRAQHTQSLFNKKNGVHKTVVVKKTKTKQNRGGL